MLYNNTKKLFISALVMLLPLWVWLHVGSVARVDVAHVAPFFFAEIQHIKCMNSRWLKLGERMFSINWISYS